MSSTDSSCVLVLVLAAALLTAPACGGREKGGQTSRPGRPPMAESGFATESSEDAPAPTEPVETDDDELQLGGTKGTLAADEVRAGLSPHLGALQDCYQSRLKERPFLAGDLTLQFRVDRTGRVGAASVVESDVGDWTVERCVLELARRMTFAQPRGGDRQATFGVPLHFASDRVDNQAWPEERIAGLVTAKRAELDACGRRAPAPSDAAVTLYVGNRGEVKAVGFSSSDPRPIADAWADCAAGKLEAWTFEDPMGKIVKTRFHYRPRAR